MRTGIIAAMALLSAGVALAQADNYAVVCDGTVKSVAAWDVAPTFAAKDALPGLTGTCVWVKDATRRVGAGHTYDGRVFTKPPAPVPAEVTDLQLRKALTAAGKRMATEAALVTASQDVRDYWERTKIIARTDQPLADLAKAAGLTSADLDTLFRNAGGM